MIYPPPNRVSETFFFFFFFAKIFDIFFFGGVVFQKTKEIFIARFTMCCFRLMVDVNRSISVFQLGSVSTWL